jgi:hypothetical protein
MLCGSAFAQTSASFKVTEHAISEAATQDAVRPASASFRVSFGAIGDAVAHGARSPRPHTAEAASSCATRRQEK